MGASSSSLSELVNNEYLKKLSGNTAITANDPFWNQLLSYSFQIPRNSADQRLLEESTTAISKNFAINNCKTGNFSSLVKVFITRAAELKACAQCEDNIFTWQTYNALFIIRNLCKYFVENLSEEVIVQQFNNQVQGNEPVSHEEFGPLTEELLNSLMEVIVDVPIVSFTYGLHLEALNTIIILLAVQMFQPTPASESVTYRHIMQGKCAIHACVFMKTLLNNFMAQTKCPPEMLKQENNAGVISAVASGLWSVMTLGLASKAAPVEEDGSDALLAKQSLLLILLLANHCTSDNGLHNPYRQALFSFTNSQDTANNSGPTSAVATFKVHFTHLYNTISNNLFEDQTTLLLYLLLHKNQTMKSFILSRTNIDVLVMPILKVLYHAPEKNSHHIYMALIVLLILSEDEFFNKAVHEINIKSVPWFKDRPVSEITLGGILVLVVIRTIQYNMTRMRDKYLHTNCLAALANMSAQFKDLHPYVTQRIVSLFSLLQRKHTRLVEQIRLAAIRSNESIDQDTSIDHDDYVQDLTVLEDVIRMVLEIINSTLSNSLHHNPNLIYTLLYNKDMFISHFRIHPTFQDIIQNIDTVVSYFTTKLEGMDKNMSPQEVLEVVRYGAAQFKRDRLKKFPELKFKYVEEDQPEEFFVPYVWSLVYHASNLYFNPSRIQLFSLHTQAEGGSA